MDWKAELRKALGLEPRSEITEKGFRDGIDKICLNFVEQGCKEGWIDTKPLTEEELLEAILLEFGRGEDEAYNAYLWN